MERIEEQLSERNRCCQMRVYVAPNQTPRLQSSSLNQKFRDNLEVVLVTAPRRKKNQDISAAQQTRFDSVSLDSVSQTYEYKRDTSTQVHPCQRYQKIRMVRSLWIVPKIREISRCGLSRSGGEGVSDS